MTVALVFPHQLFESHPAIEAGRKIWLVEEQLFFGQYRFHRQKIVFHRATMRFYESFLIEKGHAVEYVGAREREADVRVLIEKMAQTGIQKIAVAEVVDDWLGRRLVAACRKHGIELEWLATPNFLTSRPEIDGFFDGRKTYFQTDFYVWQRKRLQILIEKDGKPTGGKWTFDTENRLPFPKNRAVPTVVPPSKNRFVEEATGYAKTQFPDGYGPAEPQFIYPTTFAESRAWLDDFLENRFADFGPFEDAMVAREAILHHSVLTPMLNVGLLNPAEIIEKALDFAQKNVIPMNSLEGFVRQIVGWREFIRAVYEREGRGQRTRNFWGFGRKIPPAFWTGDTGIVPIDTVIRRTLETGYCHHIERLMVLGNFMVLCEFDPEEVHRWFMEMFIDAYDWVMVPNVFGMTQFADGGLMTTKPYISGSNYVLKMSDFEKGAWQATWDGLFWRFMHVHRSFFLKNPRLGMLVGTFDKMVPEKRAAHLEAADAFLKKLDSGSGLVGAEGQARLF